MLKLTVIGLNETEITDESLCLMSTKLLFLKKVNLNRCNVTDFGLNDIVENLRFLENLNIASCSGVSEDFKKFLGKSKIVKNVIM